MDSQTTALIVHDIKNALAVLEGELQVLGQECARTPQQARAVRAWQECTALREKLIGFLTIYKAASSGLRARVEAVSPEDFLRGLLTETRHRRDGISLTMDPAGIPALGFFDEHLVGLALDAALQNAMRFAVASVIVSCRSDDQQGLVFSIQDDGPGLAAGIADRKQTSTGLGTELCRAVAAAHRRGDQVGLCNLRDAEGGGALFELRLP